MAHAPLPRFAHRCLRARPLRDRGHALPRRAHDPPACAARDAPVRPLLARLRGPGRPARRHPLAGHRGARGAVRAGSDLPAEPLRGPAHRLPVPLRAQPSRCGGGDGRSGGDLRPRLPARRRRPLRRLPGRHLLPHRRPRHRRARRRGCGGHAATGRAVCIDRLHALLAGDPRSRPERARGLPPPSPRQARGVVRPGRRLPSRPRRGRARALVAQRPLSGPRPRRGRECPANRASARDRQRDARAPVPVAALGVPRPRERGHLARRGHEAPVRGSGRPRAGGLEAQRRAGGSPGHGRSYRRARACGPRHRRLGLGRGRADRPARPRAQGEPDRPNGRGPAPSRGAVSDPPAGLRASHRRGHPRLRRLQDPPLRGRSGARMAPAPGRGDPRLRRRLAALRPARAAGAERRYHPRGREGAHAREVRLPAQELRRRWLLGLRRRAPAAARGPEPRGAR